ncbi:hypothetical protein HK100_012701 [Physocladia obscura]|uniref:Uncharacterized protein n=1 Tax=Physocladia obscura TaxID=109957 RepID=A0AAD5SZF7_9FUNG|nr:hypothetical protein HK100_012701 [Physocladia obscura]
MFFSVHVSVIAIFAVLLQIGFAQIITSDGSVTASAAPVVQASAPTLSPEDPLSIISVIAGVAIPGIIGVVYTVSSWAAAANPCINNCLNQVPPNNTKLIQTCTTACSGSVLIAALIHSCDEVQNSYSTTGTPQPAASSARSETWFFIDVLYFILAL